MKRGTEDAGLTAQEQLDASASKRAKFTSEHEEDLQALLDLVSKDVPRERIPHRFSEIATQLLTRYYMVWQSTTADNLREEYEILELEFYLNSEKHPDPFTHGAEDQAVLGRWYFHRVPRKAGTRAAVTPPKETTKAGYKGGTRKGLDITFGNPPAQTNAPLSSRHFSSSGAEATSPDSTQHDDTLRGGILLRTLRRRSDGRVISGPSLLVDEVLRVSGASGIEDLVQNKWRNNISVFEPPSPSAASRLTLVARPEEDSASSPPQIYSSPRIGIELSNSEAAYERTNTRVQYVALNYRYFVHPKLLVANGRGHTFLGVVQHTEKDFKNDNALVDELCNRMTIKQPTALTYLAAYRTARKSGDLKQFIGAKGKGAGSGTSSFLSMAGAVQRFLDMP